MRDNLAQFRSFLERNLRPVARDGRIFHTAAPAAERGRPARRNLRRHGGVGVHRHACSSDVAAPGAGARRDRGCSWPKNIVSLRDGITFVGRMAKTFAELSFPGRLIAVEGLDGSGKSTQIYLLKRWLEQQGLKVFFSEWNSSDLVKSATSKGKKRELLTPTTFSLIHATDFADRYERQLVPLLRAGYLVLCDRYIFTAFARDTVRGCPPEWVRGLYNFAAHPDLTFFFKAQLEVSLQRILDGRPQLKYFEAGMDMRLSADPYESFRIFQGRILEQYLGMSTEFNFSVIDANQPIESQQSLVRELLMARIDLSLFAAPNMRGVR
jgi:dTMP kinase